MIFPNLARCNEDFDSAQPEVDAIVKAELKAAGIDALQPSKSFRLEGEVPTSYIGAIEGSGWTFERRWYYYAAKGNGIPPDIAEELHRTHGQSVRVDGHCACPSPTKWFKGFAVGHYHVDNAEGLKALSDTIRGVLAGGTKQTCDRALGFVLGQASTYCERVRTGGSLIAELGCPNVYLDEATQLIDEQGLRHRETQNGRERTTIHIYRDERALSLIDRADSAWAMGKLFGYGDVEVLRFISATEPATAAGWRKGGGK